jgi:hypothetical protein
MGREADFSTARPTIRLWAASVEMTGLEEWRTLGRRVRAVALRYSPKTGSLAAESSERCFLHDFDFR